MLKKILISCLILYAFFSLHYYYFTSNNISHNSKYRIIINTISSSKYQKPIYRILLIGDNQIQSSQKTTCKQIQKELQSLYPKYEIQVLDATSKQATSKTTLLEYINKYQNFKSDLVIINLGINDILESFEGFSSKSKFKIYELYLWDKNINPLIDKLFSKFIYKKTYYSSNFYHAQSNFSINFEKLIKSIKNNHSQILVLTQPYNLSKNLSEKTYQKEWIIPLKIYNKTKFTKFYPTKNSLLSAIKSYNFTIQNIALNHHIHFFNLEQNIPKNNVLFIKNAIITSSGSQKIAKLISQEIIKNQLITTHIIKIASDVQLKSRKASTNQNPILN